MLERAAKALRTDPASYQSVEGVGYEVSDSTLFRWDVHFEGGRHVVGVVGLFPLDRLIPHEATTSSRRRRPRHPVQIRPVMALVAEPLPLLDPTGPSVHFRGTHHQIVTPISQVSFDPDRVVIADGHHRVAAALRQRGDPSIMTMIVNADQTDLDAGTFHRVFHNSVTLPDSIEGCDLIREPPLEAIGAGRIAVVTRDGSIGVTVTDRYDPPALRGLPAGLAERYVLPGLGLDETDARYVEETIEALVAVDQGATAVILPSSDISSVMQLAANGLILPPKSTRFRPKAIRGLLMRPLLDPLDPADWLSGDLQR